MPIPNVNFNVGSVGLPPARGDDGSNLIDQALSFAFQQRLQEARQEAVRERAERRRQESTDRFVRRGIATGQLVPVDRDHDVALPTQMDEPGRTVVNLPGMGPPDPTSRAGRADLEALRQGEGALSTQEFETSEGEVEVASGSRVRELEAERERREVTDELREAGALPEDVSTEGARFAAQTGQLDEITTIGEGRASELESLATTIEGGSQILGRYGGVENLDDLSEADAAAMDRALRFQHRLNENLRQRSLASRRNRMQQINFRTQLGQMEVPTGGQQETRQLTTPEINGIMNAMFTPEQLSPEARDQALQLYDRASIPAEGESGFDTLATQVLETFNTVSGGPNASPREFSAMAGTMWGWVRDNDDFLTEVVGQPDQKAGRAEFRQWLNTSDAIPYRKAYALATAGQVYNISQYRELSRMGVPFGKAGVTSSTLQAASELIPQFGQARGPEGGVRGENAGRGSPEARDGTREFGPVPGATEPWNVRRVSREAMAETMDSAKVELGRAVATRLRRGNEGQVADSILGFRNAALQSPDSLINRASERVAAVRDRLENNSEALTELQKSNLQAEIDDWNMIIDLLEDDPSLHIDFVNLILDPAIEQGFGMMGRDFTTMREQVAEVHETSIESPDTLPEPGGGQ